MKFKFVLLLCCFLFLEIGFSQYAPKREFRGLWVCTAFNLDWPSSPKLSVEEKKKELLSIFDRADSLHLNVLFFQVRAAGDAFYNSDTEPWSHWLTGKQGRAPKHDFDPLKFAIEEAHKRQIELHAWFNLFRGVSHNRFAPPGNKHFAKRHKDWLYQMKSSLYVNPGNPKVRTYLTEVVKEVLMNYDIDGIHLDDYFYHEERGALKIEDKLEYETFNPHALPLEDWRRENINAIIKNVSDTIKRYKPYVKFSVSPIPVWRNIHKDPSGSDTQYALSSYDDQFADTKKWIEEGWIDYLIPQTYWGHTHHYVGFQKVTSWWENHAYNRVICVGLALYKVGTEEDGDWKDEKDFIAQIRRIRASERIKGIAFYRGKSLEVNPASVLDSIETLFNHPTLLPALIWKDSIPPHSPTNVTYKSSNDGITLNWQKATPSEDGDTAHKYLIYRFEEGEVITLDRANSIISITDKTTYTDKKALPGTTYFYLISALDRMENESTDASGVYVTHHGY